MAASYKSESVHSGAHSEANRAAPPQRCATDMHCLVFRTGRILRLMLAILFWVVIIGFSFVLELHSNAFIAVFIGFGAAISFVLALAGLPFAFQAGAWLAVSAVSLVTLRPFAMRKFHHHRFEIDMSQPTNTAMTDMRGTVEVRVGDAR